MHKIEVILKNETGLHARPASLFVREASKYKSDIKVIKGDGEYNAKSILSILSMGAGKDDKLTIIAEGCDGKEALEAIEALINNDFSGTEG